MSIDSYFRFDDDDDKTKYKHSQNNNKKGMSELKTHNPIYCMKDRWENGLNLRHTLDIIYMTIIL